MPAYIQPRSVIMNLGASAGLRSTRHRHVGITGRWLPSASTRVLHVVVLQGGHALPGLVVGRHGLERGMAHTRGRRVVEQQLVVPWLQAPRREPGGEVAQAG